jgi:hypothetical protein
MLWVWQGQGAHDCRETMQGIENVILKEEMCSKLQPRAAEVTPRCICTIFPQMLADLWLSREVVFIINDYPSGGEEIDKSGWRACGVGRLRGTKKQFAGWLESYASIILCWVRCRQHPSQKFLGGDVRGLWRIIIRKVVGRRKMQGMHGRLGTAACRASKVCRRLGAPDRVPCMRSHRGCRSPGSTRVWTLQTMLPRKANTVSTHCIFVLPEQSRTSESSKCRNIVS